MGLSGLCYSGLVKVSLVTRLNNLSNVPTDGSNVSFSSLSTTHSVQDVVALPWHKATCPRHQTKQHEERQESNFTGAAGKAVDATNASPGTLTYGH